MFAGMKSFLKDRKTYLSWDKGYYHLSSDGWQQGKLFHNEAQFAYGMTLVGLLTLRFKIVIYDFTLMDNHIHLLMSGSGAECVGAFDYFRMKISARLVQDGFPPLPEDYGFKLKPVTTPEQMRINFLYVDRNPMEKGISLPGGYPWGAAGLHYPSLPIGSFTPSWVCCLPPLWTTHFLKGCSPVQRSIRHGWSKSTKRL